MPGLRTTVDLPAPEDLKRLAIHDEHARRSIRTILAAAAERADVNAFRSAMDGVRPRVARLLEHFLRLDDLVNLRFCRVRLGIHDVDAGGTKPRNDEIAPLDERVPGERRQRGRAGVPAEMMKLVALVRHRHRMD